MPSKMLKTRALFEHRETRLVLFRISKNIAMNLMFVNALFHMEYITHCTCSFLTNSNVNFYSKFCYIE